MERLTKTIITPQREVIVYTKGKYEDTTGAEIEYQDIKRVLKRLSEYEDTDLAPREILDLKKNMNNAWTPVEERLPEVDADIEETIEDDDCPEYIVTIDGASEAAVLKYSPDGTWFDENGYTYDVVAWRPLPGPYRPWKGKTDKNIITRIIERINHLCALNSGCGAIFGNTKEKECYYKGRHDAFEQAIEEIQTIYDRGGL